MEKELRIMSVVPEVFKHTEGFLNPKFLNKDDILQDIAINISLIKGLDEDTRIGMFVAASKTLDLIQKTPFVNEKDAIKYIIGELPSIIQTIESNNEK